MNQAGFIRAHINSRNIILVLGQDEERTKSNELTKECKCARFPDPSDSIKFGCVIFHSRRIAHAKICVNLIE